MAVHAISSSVAVAVIASSALMCDALIGRTSPEPLWEPGQVQLFRQGLAGPWEPRAEPTGPQIECQTDSDCPIDADEKFRCMMVKGLARTEKNNCRISGIAPGKGNQSCLCSTMKCSKGPPEPKDPSKLQYLMIGDCITAYVRLRKEERLAKAGIEMAPTSGNAGSTNRALHCMDEWAKINENRHWDIISFNFGLHDVAHTTEHLTLDEYKMQFGKIVDKLVGVQRNTGARLLWITTTPIPAVPNNDDPDCETPLSLVKCMSPPRRDTDVIAYNEAAAQIVQDRVDQGAQIATLDLHDKVTGLCGGRGYKFCQKYQMAYNAHFTPHGYDAIGDLYEEAILSLAQHFKN